MAGIKLNKLLLQGLTEAGITELKPFQEKLVSRLGGGSSLYILGEDGLGKTTAMAIAVLQRLNYSQPDTPRAIVMMSNADDAQLLYERFKLLGKHMNLMIHLVIESGSMDDQNAAIYAGADLIIATPVRLTKLYFQCGININKVNTFVLDNAFKMVENRHLVELDRFTDSLPKFQGLVIDTQLNPRLLKACQKFMPFAQELRAE